MSFKSKYFYFKVKGPYGLFTRPESKSGGEKASYSIPTRQALNGIVDAIYFKPTFRNVVDEVKVINPALTAVMGIRALIGSGSKNSADLNYYSYLLNPEYLVKSYFVWNNARQDLAGDRNQKKHEEIFKRSLEKGGRRDAFLGTRECLATIEAIDEDYYNTAKSYYDGKKIQLGLMFQEFDYPSSGKGKLVSYFDDIEMVDGIIKFRDKEECRVKNVLSNYSYKIKGKVKSVDEELREYEEEV